MSYSIYTMGTKDEVRRSVTKTCDENTSPEMPLVKSFLLSLVESIEGDDKRALVNASGWHSGGLVSHHIDFKTISIPNDPDGPVTNTRKV